MKYFKLILVHLCLVFFSALSYAGAQNNMGEEHPEYSKFKGAKQVPDAGTAVIDGYLPYIDGSQLAIYIADIDQEIENHYVGNVTVKDGRFHFEKEIEGIKRCRVANVSTKVPYDSWFNFFLIPSFTIKISGNDENWDIENKDEYEFMVYMWLNRENMMNVLGVNPQPLTKNERRLKEIKTKIDLYVDEQGRIWDQINLLMSYTLKTGINSSKEINVLMKKNTQIQDKIIKLIEKYKTIK